MNECCETCKHWHIIDRDDGYCDEVCQEMDCDCVCAAWVKYDE